VGVFLHGFWEIIIDHEGDMGSFVVFELNVINN
jgi:hypothetical protein